jgi:hypothetical protein
MAGSEKDGQGYGAAQIKSKMLHASAVHAYGE